VSYKIGDHIVFPNDILSTGRRYLSILMLMLVGGGELIFFVDLIFDGDDLWRALTSFGQFDGLGCF
jgi:hypothetical protein